MILEIAIYLKTRAEWNIVANLFSLNDTKVYQIKKEFLKTAKKLTNQNIILPSTI